MRSEQLGFIDGAKPKKEKDMSHANRGKGFERLIDYTHALYRREGVAQVDRQHIPCILTGKNGWAKITGPATVDYSGNIRGRFMAFDAKSTKDNSISLNELKEHQHRYLYEVHTHGGIAFVLVEFPGNQVFAVPVVFWHWAQEARKLKQRIPVTFAGIEWQTTGKASVRMDEMHPAWITDEGRCGVDYLPTIERIWAGDPEP